MLWNMSAFRGVCLNQKASTWSEAFFSWSQGNPVRRAAAGSPVTLGRCCSPGFMRFFRGQLRIIDAMPIVYLALSARNLPFDYACRLVDVAKIALSLLSVARACARFPSAFMNTTRMLAGCVAHDFLSTARSDVDNPG